MKPRTLLIATFTIAGATFATLTGCSSTGASEIPDPPSSGNVLDEADILTDNQEQQLNQLIDKKNKDIDGARVAVYTYDEDRGEVKDYATELGNKWGVGNDSNNGVLITVDMENREMFIAVADGASLTDDNAETIVETDIEPNFKDDRFYQGFDSAVTDLYTYAEGNKPASVAEAEHQDALIGWIIGGLVGAFALIVGIWTWIDRCKWNRIADREIDEALAKDPGLEVNDEMRRAYRSYRRNHRTPPAENIDEHNANLQEKAQEDGKEYTQYAGTYQSWLPLYMMTPALYTGGGTNPSSSNGFTGGTSGSSFSGGGGFTGGGAGGSF